MLLLLRGWQCPASVPSLGIHAPIQKPSGSTSKTNSAYENFKAQSYTFETVGLDHYLQWLNSNGMLL